MLNKDGGSIVTMSSVWGRLGASCEAAYSAAKAGIIGLTKALAKELAPGNIRVNSIAPGVIDTKMNARLNAAEINELIARTPLGRLGTADDVANLAVFLVSKKSSFITGAVIPVDGMFT
jgi:3-oxoacyl-[acyl-carrier protein] reductase